MNLNNLNNLKEINIEIIDAHGHIGDILYPGGGELIFKTGIKFPKSFWQWFLCERVLYRETFLYKTAQKISPMWSTKRERKRNKSATLENLQKSLEDTNIVKCVCAPVAPNVTYGDVLAASQKESRIIAFTSPDFSFDNSDNIEIMRAKLESDLKDGAMGVKIHPILQEVRADSEIVMSAVEIIRKYSKPVLIHAGPAQYYLPKENKTRFADYSSVEKIGRLISAFPSVNFIVGHAGLDDYRKVIEIMPKYKNAFVDTSFQYPQSVRDLITAFGAERVMFASDWHYGLRKPMIATVFGACKDDKAIQKLVFYENAANLLGI